MISFPVLPAHRIHEQCQEDLGKNSQEMPGLLLLQRVPHCKHLSPGPQSPEPPYTGVKTVWGGKGERGGLAKYNEFQSR